MGRCWSRSWSVSDRDSAVYNELTKSQETRARETIEKAARVKLDIKDMPPSNHCRIPLLLRNKIRLAELHRLVLDKNTRMLISNYNTIERDAEIPIRSLQFSDNPSNVMIVIDVDSPSLRASL